MSDTEKKNNSSKKVGIILVVIAIIAAVAVAVFSGSLFGGYDTPKKFTADEMSINLTDDFSQSHGGKYIACFDSKKVSVFVNKEAFDPETGMEQMTVEEFGKMIIDNNSIKTTGLKQKDDLTYFISTHSETGSNAVFEYYTFIYKTNSDFWIFQFSTPKKETDKFSPMVFKWAESVEFAE